MQLEIKMGQKELTRSVFACESGDNEPKAWKFIWSPKRSGSVTIRATFVFKLFYKLMTHT